MQMIDHNQPYFQMHSTKKIASPAFWVCIILANCCCRCPCQLATATASCISAGRRFVLDQRARNCSSSNSLYGCLPEDSGIPKVSFCFDLLTNHWQDLELENVQGETFRVCLISLKLWLVLLTLLPAKGTLEFVSVSTAPLGQIVDFLDQVKKLLFAGRRLSRTDTVRMK